MAEYRFCPHSYAQIPVEEWHPPPRRFSRSYRSCTKRASTFLRKWVQFVHSQSDQEPDELFDYYDKIESFQVEFDPKIDTDFCFQTGFDIGLDLALADLVDYPISSFVGEKRTVLVSVVPCSCAHRLCCCTPCRQTPLGVCHSASGAP